MTLICLSSAQTCTFAAHTVMTFDSDIIFSGEGVGGFSIIYVFGICCSDLQRFPEVMLVVNFLMGVSAENCFCTFANNFLNIVSPYYSFGHFHRGREGGMRNNGGSWTQLI